MKTLLSLGSIGLILVLSGCDAPAPAAAPAADGPLPAAVLAALPSGVPPSVVQRDANGCYSYVNAIEIVVLREGGTDGGAPICDA